MACGIFQWSVETDESIWNPLHGFTQFAGPRMEFCLRCDLDKNVQPGWTDDGDKFALYKRVHQIREFRFTCYKQDGQVIHWKHGGQLAIKVVC